MLQMHVVYESKYSIRVRSNTGHRHGKVGLVTLSKAEKNLSIICHKGRKEISPL